MSPRTPPRHFRRARLTRRDLLRGAPVAGVGAAAVTLGVVGARSEPLRSSRGTCRFCLMRCGIEATTQGDRLLRVEGDPAARTRGFLCLHGHALREVVHAADRVRLPLMRDGDALREVGWDVALGEIARRLERIRSRYGAQALMLQTGWPLVRHPLISVLHRFCHAFGTPNLATVASLCEASGRMGKALTAGSKLGPDVGRVKTLFVWGANPSVAAPPLAHLVAQKAERGNLVVIDPVRTELAAIATAHLCVRPGTDGALALAMIHVLVSERLYDADFVARHTVGFAALAALAAEHPLERAEAVTGVARDRIARAARLLASAGPSAIWTGLGVEHHENGVQTVRAIISLEALTGRLDEPGVNAVLTPPGEHFYGEMLPALYRMRTPAPAPPEPKARPLGYERFPLFEVYNREAQGNLLAEAVLEDRPYPVRALMLFASNALVTAPGSQRLREAADRLELLVSVDPFLTASGQLSDFVLPASTFAEAPDVDDLDQEVARSGLVPLQHESWPDWKVVFELARALGLGSYFPWTSLRAFTEAPQVPFMEDSAHQPRPAPAPPGTPRPRFGTPSGKVELASSLLERFGHDPLPRWEPPTEVPRPEFPWRLVTGPRTRAFINSQFRSIPEVRSKQPVPLALIHPTAARVAGIDDGQRVRVVSPHGEVTLFAHLTFGVHPDTVVLPGGWEEANVNLLIDPTRLDPISGFPAFRSGVCRVEPARR